MEGIRISDSIKSIDSYATDAYEATEELAGHTDTLELSGNSMQLYSNYL